jgi:hypothetical protein
MSFEPPDCAFCNNTGIMEIMFSNRIELCPYGCPLSDEPEYADAVKQIFEREARAKRKSRCLKG